MARKKRTIATAVAQPQADTKPKERYQDTFQQNFGKKAEEFGKSIESQKRNLLYGLGALVVIAALIGIYLLWSSRTDAAAQSALGKAIEISETPLVNTAPAAGSTGKQFRTAKERAQAAIPEFQAVVDQYGGNVAEKAKYFIAVNQLSLDRATGVQQLEELSKAGGEVGALSKFALAQTRVDDGRADDAAALYKELASSSENVVPKDTVNLELAQIYERQGKKQEAVDLLFSVVKAASEAKDADGKAIPLTGSAQAAKDKLTELDAAKAKEIPEPALETPDPGQPSAQ